MSLVSFSDNFAQISLYQIFNYSDSISANLNNTFQTKQHAMQKTALLFKYKQNLQGTIFMVEGF